VSEARKFGASVPLARLVAEAFLIIISILLAFSLDAWWGARQEAAEEQDILGRLRAEVEANLAELSERRDAHEKVRRAAEALLALTGPTAPQDVSEDSVGRLIWDATAAWSYDPADGVIVSLIGSGRLGIIQDDSLRTELAGWPALVSDMQEDEEAAWRVVDSRITPFLDRHLAWRTLADLSADSAGSYGPGRSEFPNEVVALLQNREFENLIAGKLDAEESILSFSQQLVQSLERTLRLIDQQLRSDS